MAFGDCPVRPASRVVYLQPADLCLTLVLTLRVGTKCTDALRRTLYVPKLHADQATQTSPQGVQSPCRDEALGAGQLSGISGPSAQRLCRPERRRAVGL